MGKAFNTAVGIIICFFVLPLGLTAQQQEAALAHIDYEFVHVYDTTNRDQPNKTNMRLLLGQQSSQYLNQTIADQRERAMAMLQERGITVEITGVRMSVTQRNISSGSALEELFLYPQQKKLLKIDGISSTVYTIEQEYPELAWEIGQETREIGGFAAQQARTYFGGRYYTAWFTPEIPLPLGPWKFHGLPGLILEVEDDAREVQFLYKDFVRLEDGELKIALPENAVAATTRQFDRAKAAYDNNPNAGNRSSIPTGATGQIDQVVITIDASGNRQTLSGDAARAELERRRLQTTTTNYNNPIEKNNKN